MQKIKELVKKLWNFAFHTEGGLYLVFGVLTTLVSLAAYYVSILVLGRTPISDGAEVAIATVVKNVSGIIFAYFTNRGLVFGSTAKGIQKLYEFLKFTASRLLTFALDMLLSMLLVEKAGMNKNLIGLLTSVIVIILNYVLSKLFVFTKKK